MLKGNHWQWQDEKISELHYYRSGIWGKHSLYYPLRGRGGTSSTWTAFNKERAFLKAYGVEGHSVSSVGTQCAHGTTPASQEETLRYISRVDGANQPPRLGLASFGDDDLIYRS